MVGRSQRQAREHIPHENCVRCCCGGGGADLFPGLLLPLFLTIMAMPAPVQIIHPLSPPGGLLLPYPINQIKHITRINCATRSAVSLRSFRPGPPTPILLPFAVCRWCVQHTYTCIHSIAATPKVCQRKAARRWEGSLRASASAAAKNGVGVGGAVFCYGAIGTRGVRKGTLSVLRESY